MAELHVEVEGLDEVEEGLGALRGALQPGGLRRVLGECGLIVERRIKSSFAQERAPRYVADVGKAGQAAGSPWKPLAPSTIAARRGGGAKILRDTGALSASIETHVGADYVEVGTGSEIGLYQHGGTDPYTIVPREKSVLRFIGAGGVIVFAKKVRHPGLAPRPFVGIDDSDSEEMGERIVEHIETAVASSE